MLAKGDRMETMAEQKAREQAELRDRLNRRMDHGLEMQAQIMGGDDFSLVDAGKRFISRITLGANAETARMEEKARLALASFEEIDLDDSDSDDGVSAVTPGDAHRYAV